MIIINYVNCCAIYLDFGVFFHRINKFLFGFLLIIGVTLSIGVMISANPGVIGVFVVVFLQLIRIKLISYNFVGTRVLYE